MHVQSTALNTKVKNIITIRVLGLPVWTRVFKVDFIVVNQQKAITVSCTCGLLWPDISHALSQYLKCDSLPVCTLGKKLIILERQSSQGGQRSFSLPSEGT